MELLESNEERGKLLRESAKQREALKGEVKLISENTEKIVTNALVIGGSLALTYWLVTRFSGSAKKKNKRKNKTVKVVHASGSPGPVEVESESQEPGIIGQIGAAVATQASMFLLNLAKEKLLEYLQSMQEKKQPE